MRATASAAVEPVERPKRLGPPPPRPMTLLTSPLRPRTAYSMSRRGKSIGTARGTSHATGLLPTRRFRRAVDATAGVALVDVHGAFLDPQAYGTAAQGEPGAVVPRLRAPSSRQGRPGGPGGRDRAGCARGRDSCGRRRRGAAA